jgi:hypothetical protein
MHIIDNPIVKIDFFLFKSLNLRKTGIIKTVIDALGHNSNLTKALQVCNSSDEVREYLRRGKYLRILSADNAYKDFTS